MKLNEPAAAKQKYFEQGNTHPICENEGCNRKVIVKDWRRWSFRKICYRCREERRANKILGTDSEPTINPAARKVKPPTAKARKVKPKTSDTWQDVLLKSSIRRKADSSD